MEDVVDIVIGEARRYFNAPMNRFWFGPHLTIIATDPGYILKLLNHPLATHKEEFIYGGFSDIAGKGVFTRNGDEWRRMRKDLMNRVQPKSLQGFQQLITRRLATLCSVLDSKSLAGPVDLPHYLKLFALDVVIESSMGMESINETENNKYNFPVIFQRAMHDAVLFSISAKRIFGIASNKKLRDWARLLTELPKDILRHRQQYIQKYGEPEKSNLADLVLSTGKIEGLTLDEMSEVAIDLLIAGMDTSSVVMSTTLLMLAIHQNCQERAYNELKDIFGDSTRQPEEEDLKKMEYLDMCVNEALRHCAPPVTARRVEDNIHLDDYVLPKGAILFLGHEMLLKDPKYWENPESFYPEHFTTEAVRSRPKGALMPFNAGPRRCPAQAYSFQLMRNTISTILRRYHLSSLVKFEDLNFKFSLLKEPSNYSIILKRRT
ncbi:cytochrome P450 [Nesidiocoris tenuis]|uniref:Cytochrome P450 n=2 Tax=Nesidiocoris tenuis TaxID=355587 RepID=A0ABN7ADS9_9HEMI|nr:cytochrome P450 [Nesidiocoris tenuis]